MLSILCSLKMSFSLFSLFSKCLAGLSWRHFSEASDLKKERQRERSCHTFLKRNKSCELCAHTCAMKL